MFIVGNLIIFSTLELNTINDKASAEIIQIEQKYNELRKPFFEKRQTFIEGIPNFWLTVVCF